VFLGIELYLLSGNRLYAHGPSAMLLLLAALSGGLACLWEAVALPICLYKLARDVRLRTRINLLAVFLALLYLVASGIFAVNITSE
jgi:hypothetical protein